MYKLRLDANSEVDSNTIQKTEVDGTVKIVPNDASNADWQAYQAWLALDNEPEPAE